MGDDEGAGPLKTKKKPAAKPPAEAPPAEAAPAAKPKGPVAAVRQHYGEKMADWLKERAAARATKKAAKAETKESERLAAPQHIVGIVNPESGIEKLCARYRKSMAGMDAKQVTDLIKLIYNHMKTHEIDAESAKAMSLMIAKLYGHPAVQQRFPYGQGSAVFEPLKAADRILYDAMRYARGVVGFGDVPALQQQIHQLKIRDTLFAFKDWYEWPLLQIQKSIAQDGTSPTVILPAYDRNWTAAAGPSERFLLSEHIMGVSRIAGVRNKGSVAAATRAMGIPMRSLSPPEQVTISLEWQGKVTGSPQISDVYGRAAAARDGIIRNRLAGTADPARRAVLEGLLRSVQDESEGKLKGPDDVFKDVFGNEKAMAGLKKQSMQRIDEAEARALRIARERGKREIDAARSQARKTVTEIAKDVENIQARLADAIKKITESAKARREAVEGFYKRLAEAGNRADMVRVLSTPPHEAREAAVFLRGGVDNRALAQQIEATRIMHPAVVAEVAAGEAHIEGRGPLVRGVVPVVKGKAKRLGLGLAGAAVKVGAAAVPAVEEAAAAGLEARTVPRRTGRGVKKQVIAGAVIAGGVLAYMYVITPWLEAEQRRELDRMGRVWGTVVTKATLANRRSSPLMELFYMRMEARNGNRKTAVPAGPQTESELWDMMQGRPGRMASYLDPSALSKVMAEAAVLVKKHESELDSYPGMREYRDWLKKSAMLYDAGKGKWRKADDAWIKAHLTWLANPNKTEDEIGNYRTWLVQQNTPEKEADARLQWMERYSNRAAGILNNLDSRTRVMRAPGEAEGEWRGKGYFVTEGEIFVENWAKDLRLSSAVTEYLKGFAGRPVLVLAWQAVMDGSLPRVSVADFVNEVRKDPAKVKILEDVFWRRSYERKQGKVPYSVFQSLKDAGLSSVYLLEQPIPKDSLMDIYDQRAVKYPNKYGDSFREMLKLYVENPGIRDVLNAFLLKATNLMVYGDIAQLAKDVSGGVMNYDMAVANRQVADKVFSRLGITTLIDPEADLARIKFVYDHSEGNTGLIKWLIDNERNIRNAKGIIDYFMGDTEFGELKGEGAYNKASDRAKKELQRFWRGYYVPTAKKAAGPAGPNPLEVAPRLLVKTGEAPASAPAVSETELGLWGSSGATAMRKIMVDQAGKRAVWTPIARDAEKAKKIVAALNALKLDSDEEKRARESLVRLLSTGNFEGKDRAAAVARVKAVMALKPDSMEAAILTMAAQADIEAKGPAILNQFILGLSKKKDPAEKAKEIEAAFGIRVTFAADGSVAGIERPKPEPIKMADPKLRAQEEKRRAKEDAKKREALNKKLATFFLASYAM